jgi:3-methyladenine DNA glycosylase AlkD
VSKQLRDETAGRVWQLADRLMEDGDTRARFFACGLVRHHPAAYAKTTAAKLRRLSAGMDSWAAVDIFATMLAGHAFRDELIADTVIARWARSKDRWWRRAALVCTVPLNVAAQGGRGDARRTLQVCELLVADREDMVVKALSWALRALAVRDAKAVTVFTKQHGATLAARVLREVRNKLHTGLKTPKFG